jgi:maleate isomerase
VRSLEEKETAPVPRVIRVGLIVPSSNVTMETEIPALLRRYGDGDCTFTFHSSRMSMRRVVGAGLAELDRESERCARDLTDAPCDVLAYGCLLAIMASRSRHHEAIERRLEDATRANGATAAVITSGGALVEAIVALGAGRVAVVTPYVKPLTALVVGYVENCGIEVVDALGLGVSDDREGALVDKRALLDAASRLELHRADALVLSPCMEMPSLSIIQPAEDRFGLPVLSGATATARAILKRLGIPSAISNAGSLLAGGELVYQCAAARGGRFRYH